MTKNFSFCIWYCIKNQKKESKKNQLC